MANESGLARQLSERQMSMMALGGAIGTGLFLGSALAVRIAGPGVILSYVFAAGITLLLMGCLAEMAVAHPTVGSFGVYAGLYLSPWAGFAIRYTYWAAQSIAVGGEAVAAAIYTQWWFPNSPAWVWVLFYSAVLIFVNARSVGAFGEFEYWFSVIKVIAIVVFILLGAAILFGVHQQRPIGLENFRAYGGFLPKGWLGVWLALAFVIFSFIGSEVIAVSAGEAKDPQRTIPRAMRSMLARLIIFYVGSIAILVGVIPWTQIQPGQSITVSPFVRVFDVMHIPAAAHIVNFVVLTAALSSMNCNLYLGTRMVFSLARAGYAPAVLGRVSSNSTPLPALLVSAAGLGNALCVCFSGLGLCVHVGHLVVWRTLRLAAHLPHPSWLPTALANGRRFPSALRDAAVSRDDNPRWARRSGGPDLDLVGPRNAGHTGGGRPLAFAGDNPLLRLGTPQRRSDLCTSGQHARSRGLTARFILARSDSSY